MTHSRDFGPLAGDMRAALERYTKDELVDLMTHFVRVYVLEENAPLTPEVAPDSAPSELSRLSFAQLLVHLQMTLELEELDRFRVSGEQIYVTIGEEEFLIDGPTPTLPPEAIARSGPQAQTVAEAEASLEPRAAAAAAPAAMSSSTSSSTNAAPRSPVTREPDFDGDLDDVIARRHEEDLRKAREAAGLPPERPRPQPVSRPANRGGAPGGGSNTSRSGGRSPRPGGMDSLFGGGGSSSGIGRPLSMHPPAPPPPIAERAPGDPTAQERDAARAASSRAADESAGDERRGARAGFEEPPALADGDREIKSSNRFADLELD